MTRQKPADAVDSQSPTDAGMNPAQEGHIPASEHDESLDATRRSDERDTHLPASESEVLASSDVGERILERGLTRLPPG